jgi:predicted AAA+ superfamily ATPase
MDQFYERWQLNNLRSALKTRRVLLITGARQCGKTTLAKQLNVGSKNYRTLDDIAIRRLAEIDPNSFLNHSGDTLIIDEIQRVPELLSAIKMVVDNNTKPGQFVLTGSADISSIPSAKESLAGRIRKLRLRTLSEGEILNSKPTFIQQAFEQKFLQNSINYTRGKVIESAFRGGYPEAVKLEPYERTIWHRDYLNALLDKDLQQIAKIHRLNAMKDLVNTLAAWSGKFMDISAISSGLSISRPTLESYINALETLYVIETIHPWTHTDYARVGKQKKVFMNDSGLMASTLRWNIDQVQLDADRSGKLIETFVFNEIASQIDASNEEYTLYHYRDREQHEIDFLIERADDLALLGIEIKAGSAISQNDFKHLRWFKENLAKDRTFIGITLYTGELIGEIGKGLWAIPFSALWSS